MNMDLPWLVRQLSHSYQIFDWLNFYYIMSVSGAFYIAYLLSHFLKRTFFPFALDFALVRYDVPDMTAEETEMADMPSNPYDFYPNPDDEDGSDRHASADGEGSRGTNSRGASSHSRRLPGRITPRSPKYTPPSGPPDQAQREAEQRRAFQEAVAFEREQRGM